MRRLVAASSIVIVGVMTGPLHASAQAPDDSVVDEVTDEQGDVSGGDDSVEPPPVLPLIPVPSGCSAPQQPHIVFVGDVVDRDYRTVRFEIEQVRSGRPAPFANDGRIDVRYGIDTQYLDDGKQYLVAAVVDPDLGLLVSRVTEPIENFGGDDVIGVSETDVRCEEFEDPMRTLEVDGTPVDSSVIEPFLSARVRILGALLLPVAVALGLIFVLATFRLSVSGLYRSVTGSGRES